MDPESVVLIVGETYARARQVLGPRHPLVIGLLIILGIAGIIFVWWLFHRAHRSRRRPIPPPRDAEKGETPIVKAKRPNAPEKAAKRPNAPEKAAKRPTAPDMAAKRPTAPEKAAKRPNAPEEAAKRPDAREDLNEATSGHAPPPMAPLPAPPNFMQLALPPPLPLVALMRDLQTGSPEAAQARLRPPHP